MRYLRRVEVLGTKECCNRSSYRSPIYLLNLAKCSCRGQSHRFVAVIHPYQHLQYVSAESQQDTLLNGLYQEREYILMYFARCPRLMLALLRG